MDFVGPGGRLLGRENIGTTTEYTYDHNNKLTKIEYPSGSTSSEYKYNGGSLRVKKVASDGTETYFIYDGSSVIMEVDTNGDAQATYTYGASGLISQKLGSTSYYVGCDHLGSVWDLVTLDEDENVDVSYVYTAFGNTDRSVRQGATDSNDAYRYVGALGYYADADDNHGLLLLGARYYNPSVGRFITLDPARDSLNWYVYVGSNPVVSVDPFGTFKFPKDVFDWFKDCCWVKELSWPIGSGPPKATLVLKCPCPKKSEPDDCPKGWSKIVCEDGSYHCYPPGKKPDPWPCKDPDPPEPPDSPKPPDCPEQ